MASRASGPSFYKKLLDEHRPHCPACKSVAAAWWIPLSGSEIGFNFDVEERPLPAGQQPIAQVNVVTADYFKTMRVPLLRGRAFTERDDETATAGGDCIRKFRETIFSGRRPDW